MSCWGSVGASDGFALMKGFCDFSNNLYVHPKATHGTGRVIYIHFFPRLTLVATVVRTQSLFLSHLASMVFNLPCPAG